jgi:hypothetical protein
LELKKRLFKGEKGWIQPSRGEIERQSFFDPAFQLLQGENSL